MSDYRFDMVMVASGVLVVALTANIHACGTLKDAGRSLNDAASIMCNVFAVELSEVDPERLGGKSATDYCAIHDNLSPFIDQALSVKNAAVAASLAGPVAPAPTPAADAGTQ